MMDCKAALSENNGDMQAAVDCYNSPEYTRLVGMRSPHSEGDIVVVEGYEGVQP